jgi:hypothetical protein
MARLNAFEYRYAEFGHIYAVSRLFKASSWWRNQIFAVAYLSSGCLRRLEITNPAGKRIRQARNAGD